MLIKNIVKVHPVTLSFRHCLIFKLICVSHGLKGLLTKKGKVAYTRRKSRDSFLRGMHRMFTSKVGTICLFVTSCKGTSCSSSLVSTTSCTRQNDEWVHFLVLPQLPVANRLPARVMSCARSQSVTSRIRDILLHQISVRADFCVFKLAHLYVRISLRGQSSHF